jgi:lipid-A-disaccharide synthase-like uncharacterized protein
MRWTTWLQIALLVLCLLALANETISDLWVLLGLAAVAGFSLLRVIAFARTGEVDTSSGYPRWFWKMAMDEKDEKPEAASAKPTNLPGINQ